MDNLKLTPTFQFKFKAFGLGDMHNDVILKNADRIRGYAVHGGGRIGANPKRKPR
ncbi:hypothetical protein GCM10011273_28180 [Asticcacaulis endophyticus]|uniref:Uncharacterized protein n=1 Tax=Asticcacaulis endophyticus TaxID=1395890 RepID=A0A918UXF9_9CAUL|nr:hypothetical protein GCM10011273_28180 [Asticcacaulis endophyticus]